MAGIRKLTRISSRGEPRARGSCGVERENDENSDFLCRLVHPVGALLAVGVAGAGPVSDRLASFLAAAAYRHFGQCSLRTLSRCVVPPGPASEFAKISATCARDCLMIRIRRGRNGLLRCAELLVCDYALWWKHIASNHRETPDHRARTQLLNSFALHRVYIRRLP